MTIKGALSGGNLNPVKFVGDAENGVSIATVGAYLARDLMKESLPYYREYTDGALEIFITYHFLKEVRRQLSGDIAVDSSTFSAEEITFYQHYKDWNDGVAKSGELLQALESLDQWFVDEIMLVEHPVINRDYATDHKWRKTDTRDEGWY